MPNLNCDRRRLGAFLDKRLDEDRRLEFLLHLDDCPRCWEAVYAASKAEHPHYYKSRPKKAKKDKTNDAEPISEVA